MSLFDDALGGNPPVLPDTSPTPPPLIPNSPLAESQPGGAEKLAKILKVVLPLIATAYSLKTGGGLGAFADSYGRGEQNNVENQDRIQQRKIQQDSINRQIAAQASNEAHQHRLEVGQMEASIRAAQEKEAARKAAEDARNQSLIQHALDKASDNPTFMDKVNKNGPENFSLTVPGLGNINVRDAFDKLGVIKGPDGYQYGKPADDPLVSYREDTGGSTTEELIPRSEAAKRGKHVVSRPTPKEPAAAKATRSYTWKDDDPESETFGKSFRIVEDDQGKEISKKLLTGIPAPLASHDQPTAPGSMKVGRFTVISK